MNLIEQKALRKREEILKTSIRLIEEKGFSGVTMNEIAAELMMTKGSLYYYFNNKSDLMFQCHNFVLSKATEDLKKIQQGTGEPDQILRDMIQCHIDYAVEEKEVFNMIMEPKRLFSGDQLDRVLSLRKDYEALFDIVIHQGLSTGAFQTNEPKIIRMMILGAMNWIQQWYQKEGKLSVDELKQIYSYDLLKLLK